jgi:hypothetical protein
MLFKIWEIKMKKYIHYILKLGWFRISIFILGLKFSIRLELSQGWE